MTTNQPDTPHMKAMMRQMLSERNVETIARLINEPEAKARTAISTVLPTLIAALGQAAASSDGAERLAAALDRDHDGSLLNELDSYVVSGGDVVQGRKILKHVLGDRQAGIEQKLANASKLDVADMSKVMAGMAPVVMAALGADARESAVGSRGLADLLLGNNSPISALLGGGSQGGVQGGGGMAGALGGALGSALLGSLLGGGSSSGSSSQGGSSDLMGSLLGSVLGGGSSGASSQSAGSSDMMGALLGGLMGGGSSAGSSSQGSSDMLGSLLGGLMGGGGSGSSSAQAGSSDMLGSLLGGLMGGGAGSSGASMGGQSGSTSSVSGGTPTVNTGGGLSDMIAGMNTSQSASAPKPSASKPKPSSAKPKPAAQSGQADGSAMLGSLLSSLLTGKQ